MVILIWVLMSRGARSIAEQWDVAIGERTRELVAEAGGVWDSHPDPEIGRVLMPDLDGRRDLGVSIHSNHYGVREAAYSLPKPAGVVRVVLLGDSMVFGYRMPEEARAGVLLADQLRPELQRAGMDVECLHLGNSAWNLRAECAFLRRQVSLLQPDVVIHFVVGNDLDDNPSVRGFGAMADFTDQWRTHGDGTITDTHPRFLGAGETSTSPLNAALDFEGRSRFETVANDVTRLRDAIVAKNGRYVLVIIDPVHWPASMRYLGGVLDHDEIAFLPNLDASMRLAANDSHWNSRGMQTVADYCDGLLRARSSLGRQRLSASPRTEELFARLNSNAETEARNSGAKRDAENRIGSVICFEFDGSHASELRQVYGGILQPGIVLPYASMIVRNESARVLRVEGELFDRPELRGGGVNVFVDEACVGRFGLVPVPGSCGRGFSCAFELPECVRSRRFVSVRFVSDDWVLDGKDLRTCACFFVHRVELD